MTNTTARMTPEQRANSTPIHVRGEDGAWVATDVDWAQEPDYWGGGHFLYSTPRDYLRFQQMLLGCGMLGDVQILERATVAAAFANQIGALDFPPAITTAHPELSADVNLGPGLKWGFGLLLNPAPFPGMRAAGSGSWSGLFNTHFWVDPASGVTARSTPRPCRSWTHRPSSSTPTSSRPSTHRCEAQAHRRSATKQRQARGRLGLEPRTGGL